MNIAHVRTSHKMRFRRRYFGSILTCFRIFISLFDRNTDIILLMSLFLNIGGRFFRL